VNPEEQADLEAIFGKDALEKQARRASDRRTEGWARREGSALPDMRRGSKAVPLDPLDFDAPEPTSRNRFRNPVVDPVAQRKVRTKSGQPRNYQTALTLEEYTARVAKHEADNAAALEAARLELEERPQLLHRWLFR